MGHLKPAGNAVSWRYSMTVKIRYMISDSAGMTIQFPEREIYERFKKEQEQLQLKFYEEIREKYGIWASNQDKFVATPDDLNDMDCRYMENLREKYLQS